MGLATRPVKPGLRRPERLRITVAPSRPASPAMDAASLDFARARALMVDGQIRPNKVTDPRILAAVGTLPRERFLPPHLAPLAYVDAGVELGGGRYLTEPLAIARLVQLAEPVAAERALLVGAGT